MSPEFEGLVKNKDTLCDVRDAISKNPNLTAALQDSMSAPLITVAQRFLTMELKGIGVGGNPASTESMSELFSRMSFTDLTLEDKLSAAALQKATALQKFLKFTATPTVARALYGFSLRSFLSFLFFHCRFLTPLESITRSVWPATF